MPDCQSGPTPPAPAQETSLWRHADFVKLWSGQTASLFGSAITGLALQFIAVVTLEASAVEIGLLGAVGTAPALVVGPIAGVWVDRLQRRTLMIASDLIRALLLTTIPIAAFLDILSMAQLYTVGFLAGSARVVFGLAARSYLPSIVERQRLVEGNAKLKISSSITSVAGHSLAGLVIQAISALAALLVDAVTYLLSAFCVLAIRSREEAPHISASPLLAQVRQGLGLVFGNPLLRAFAGCTTTSNFTSQVLFSLYILFGVRELGLNAAELGLIYGIGASGALVGALIGPWATARFGLGRTLVGGAVLGSLEVLPVAFATPDLAMLLLLLSGFVGHFGWTVYSINETSLRQAVIPMDFQGRMNATMLFIGDGMLPVGALVGGVLGEVFGLREAITAAAFGSLLSFLWVLFSPARSMERIPEAP